MPPQPDTPPQEHPYDAIVIGAGIVGSAVAADLRRRLPRVLLVEREPAILRRASYVNQARVHNGYHYPRSLLTALRSRVNYPRFVEEFSDCIVRDFDHYYAIARRFSNVTADQFATFTRRLGVPLDPAPANARALFDPHLIEDVFQVQEYAFDAVKLAKRFRDRLADPPVELRLETTATHLSPTGDGFDVTLRGPAGTTTVTARAVFNCTYSRTNHLLADSGLPIVPLRHELTEMPLLRVPESLRHVGVTVMDGPFFSIIPFPPRQLHSLHHVRYTPHGSWADGDGRSTRVRGAPERGAGTRVELMLRDASRYLPALADAEYVDSLWETKTILPASDADDSRPILFRRDPAHPRLVSIVGGKIDNFYDILPELDSAGDPRGSTR